MHTFRKAQVIPVPQFPAKPSYLNEYPTTVSHTKINPFTKNQDLHESTPTEGALSQDQGPIRPLTNEKPTLNDLRNPNHTFVPSIRKLLKLSFLPFPKSRATSMPKTDSHQWEDRPRSGEGIGAFVESISRLPKPGTRSRSAALIKN